MDRQTDGETNRRKEKTDVETRRKTGKTAPNHMGLWRTRQATKDQSPVSSRKSTSSGPTLQGLRLLSRFSYREVQQCTVDAGHISACHGKCVSSAASQTPDSDCPTTPSRQVKKKENVTKCPWAIGYAFRHQANYRTFLSHIYFGFNEIRTMP